MLVMGIEPMLIGELPSLQGEFFVEVRLLPTPRGAVTTDFGYLMSFDSALKSSVPALPSRSKTTTSVVVIAAPARAARSRPTRQLGLARDDTPSATTWTWAPRPRRPRTVCQTQTCASMPVTIH